MLSLLHRIVYGPRVPVILDIPMMADCSYCKNCVSMRMANRLTVHLIDDHKLLDEQAYETVNWVFVRLRDHLRK